MTTQLTQAAEKKVDVEIERLTYSAYLLTLDPSVSLSVVVKALDDSLDDVTTGTNLLQRIVELSLQQLRHEPIGDVDRESSAFEVIVYADYKASGSSRLLPFKDDAGMNPILALDAGSRIAFVLHHVLGYPVNEAAALAHIKQKEFRSHLRHAYVQLTFVQLGSLVPPQTFVVGCAQA